MKLGNLQVLIFNGLLGPRFDLSPQDEFKSFLFESLECDNVYGVFS